MFFPLLLVTINYMCSSLIFTDHPREDSPKLPPAVHQTPSHCPDISYLNQMAQYYYDNGLAPATKSTYATGQHRYAAFYKSINTHAMPATEKVLILFATHLATSDISYVTIKVYLCMFHLDSSSSSINNLHHVSSRTSRESRRPRQLPTHQRQDSLSL